MIVVCSVGMRKWVDEEGEFDILSDGILVVEYLIVHLYLLVNRKEQRIRKLLGVSCA